MKKRIIVLLVMLVLLALIIGVRMIGSKPISSQESTTVEEEQTDEPGSAPESSAEGVESNVSTPAPTENTQVPQVTTESTGNTGNEQPETSAAATDPNMTGEITPDMTVEDEMEVGLDDNTSGGLM